MLTLFFSIFCKILFSALMYFKLSAPLSDGARSHLLQVYSLLTMGVLTASSGCYLDMNYLHWGGMGTALAGALLFGIARSGSLDNQLGSAVFLLASGLEGMALSPLVHTAAVYYPQALTTALLSSLAVFVSFSFAALIAKRREFFYLFGILATVGSFLALASLTNLVVRSSFILDMQLYGGLFMFLGYILLDTQVMIDRFESGYNRTNIVRPACDLFADLVGVFVRLLIILMKKAEKPRRQSLTSSISPERKYYKRQSE